VSKQVSVSKQTNKQTNNRNYNYRYNPHKYCIKWLLYTEVIVLDKRLAVESLFVVNDARCLIR